MMRKQAGRLDLGMYGDGKSQAEMERSEWRQNPGRVLEALDKMQCLAQILADLHKKNQCAGNAGFQQLVKNPKENSGNFSVCYSLEDFKQDVGYLKEYVQKFLNSVGYQDLLPPVMESEEIDAATWAEVISASHRSLRKYCLYNTNWDQIPNIQDTSHKNSGRTPLPSTPLKRTDLKKSSDSNVALPIQYNKLWICALTIVLLMVIGWSTGGYWWDRAIPGRHGKNTPADTYQPKSPGSNGHKVPHSPPPSHGTDLIGKRKETLTTSAQPDNPAIEKKTVPASELMAHLNINSDKPSLKLSFDGKEVMVPLAKLTSGKFRQSCVVNEKNYQRDIKVETKFFLGATEVTCEQFRLVISDSNIGHCPQSNGQDMPVTYIKWDDAVNFCFIINTALDDNDYEVRLPWEFEWEHGARQKPQLSSKNFGKYAWMNESNKLQIYPVGRKYPNNAGLYDMWGNVEEWVGDEFDDLAYMSTKTLFKTPKGILSERVIRGGSIKDSINEILESDRRGYHHDRILSFLGFRIAVVPSQGIRVRALHAP